MTAPPVRVLVVDDSAFARKVVCECLTAAGLQVVGIAHDGLEALELIKELAPEVVTLDLVMPNLDGVGVLKALAGERVPQVVVVSMSDGESMLGLAALRAGAFDVVYKPTALAIAQLYEIGDRLVQTVKAAAAARRRPLLAAAPGPAAGAILGTFRELLVIAASTGGPQAISHLVSSLPANFPVPVAIVLHIPPGYTAALASRLDEECPLEVVEAAEGLAVRQGRVVIARAGRHLRVARQGGALECRLDAAPLEASHRPSADVLFSSAAKAAGSGTLGVVLTGMGDDGMLGAQAICAAGGTVLTESAGSCVVYGMPRAVMEAGLSAGEAPIEEMAELIRRFL